MSAFPRGFFELRVEGEPSSRPLYRLKAESLDRAGNLLSASVPIRLRFSSAGKSRAFVKLGFAAERFLLEDESHRDVGKVQWRPLSKYEVAVRNLARQIDCPGQAWEFLRRGIQSWRRAGLRSVLAWLRFETKKEGLAILDDYDLWIARYDRLTDEDRSAIALRVERLARKPIVSVVMPVYNTDERWLRRAIESVRAQLYPRWELCIADDGSTLPHVRRLLESYRAADPRIKMIFRTENGHISAASNSALELATGEFVALLDHDDELAEHALFRVVTELERHPDTDIFYSDEDKIDGEGRRFCPHFKPQWNLHLLRSFNLMTHLSVYRASLLQELGGFRKGFEGSQDYDLSLRACEKSSRIRHIPEILYHWRAVPGSVSVGGSQKGYAERAARQAIREHLGRQGVRGTVERGYAGFHRVRYSLPNPRPRAEVFVLAGGDRTPVNPAFLRARTRYQPLRITVLQAEERRELSVLANAAAAESAAEVLLFIDDTTVPSRLGWLEEMVSIALQPGVGAVGAKILSHRSRVIGGGVILGLRGLVGPAHWGISRRDPGYMSRAKVIQEYSAVASGCLAVRRGAFEDGRGFDTGPLSDGYRDVDLCLRLKRKGYRIVWSPYAELFQSRTAIRPTPEALEYLRRRWQPFVEADPCYNPNLDLDRAAFSLAFPPRVKRPWNGEEPDPPHDG